MKKLLIILLLIMTIKGHSQLPFFATKNYVDSSISIFANTLDSTIKKMPFVTTTNQTVVIDTMTIDNNSSKTFELFIETDDDMAQKKVKIQNITGVYTIIKDKDELLLSTTNFMSTYPRWSVRLINNQVIVQIVGAKNKMITWRLSRTIL